MKVKVLVRGERDCYGKPTGDRELDLTLEIAYDALDDFLRTLADVLKNRFYVEYHEGGDNPWIAVVLGGKDFEKEMKEIVKEMRSEYMKLRRAIGSYFRKLSPLYLKVEDASSEAYPWRIAVALVDKPNRFIRVYLGIFVDGLEDDAYSFDLDSAIDIYEFNHKLPLRTMLKIVSLKEIVPIGVGWYEVVCDKDICIAKELVTGETHGV